MCGLGKCMLHAPWRRPPPHKVNSKSMPPKCSRRSTSAECTSRHLIQGIAAAAAGACACVGGTFEGVGVWGMSAPLQTSTTGAAVPSSSTPLELHASLRCCARTEHLASSSYPFISTIPVFMF